MRFHSVLLQTIVNGSNYILDYTEIKKGKIVGFVNDIDNDGFYNNRCIHLQKLLKEDYKKLNNWNNDGVFDDSDLVDFGTEGKHVPGGLLKQDGGIPTQPAVADDPDSCESGQCAEKKFIGTSNATIEVITESSGPATQRRQNWREVN
jgi:hypothetical protein